MNTDWKPESRTGVEEKIAKARKKGFGGMTKENIEKLESVKKLLPSTNEQRDKMDYTREA